MNEPSTHEPHGHPPAGGDEHAAHADDHGSHGLAKYIYVFVALCVLTSASFFTYSSWWPYHDTPAVGWSFMMAVSFTKAMLVILFFMHVKYEANWKYVLTIPAALMSMFLILMLVPDIGMRSRMAADEIKRHQAEPAGAAHPPAGAEVHGAAAPHGH